MTNWQIPWRITGVLLIVLGIVGLAAITVWYGQTVHTVPEEMPRAWPIIFIFPGCLMAIAAGIITVIRRFWQDYPRVIILYTIALVAGFTAIGLGYAASNDSGLETAVSALGICIVILTSLTILLRNHSVAGCVRHSKAVLFALIMSLLVFVLYGYVLPQWFDAATRYFPDPKLRMAIREEVGRTLGWVQQADLEKITYLDAHYRDVTDITGLEKCVGIVELWLFGNWRLSDITPLSDLSKLEKIRLFWCDVSDITPLSNLTNLLYLELNGNSVVDISPLVENEGLGEGDVVSLRDNPLNEDSINVYIPQLQQRGVDVSW